MGLTPRHMFFIDSSPTPISFAAVIGVVTQRLRDDPDNGCERDYTNTGYILKARNTLLYKYYNIYVFLIWLSAIKTLELGIHEASYMIRLHCTNLYTLTRI